MYVVVKTEADKVYAQGVDAILVEDIPYEASLTMGDIFPGADPATHTMVWWAAATLPESFTLGADATLLPSDISATPETPTPAPMSLAEQVAAGLLTLAPNQKIVDNQIVTKSLKEQLDEGTLVLRVDHKLVEDPVLGYQIVEMTLSEKVRKGLISMGPTQKIVTNAEGAEEIVAKSLYEQYTDGGLSIRYPLEVVSADKPNELRKPSVQEILDENLIVSAAHGKVVLDHIVGEMIATIEAAYSPAEEMKITKGYLEAVSRAILPAEVQTPLNDADPRVASFRRMQADIEAIKAKYAVPKAAVRQRILALA